MLYTGFIYGIYIGIIGLYMALYMVNIYIYRYNRCFIQALYMAYSY